MQFRQIHNLDALGHEAWMKDRLGEINVTKVTRALCHVSSTSLTPKILQIAPVHMIDVRGVRDLD